MRVMWIRQVGLVGQVGQFFGLGGVVGMSIKQVSGLRWLWVKGVQYVSYWGKYLMWVNGVGQVG